MGEVRRENPSPILSSLTEERNSYPYNYPIQGPLFVACFIENQTTAPRRWGSQSCIYGTLLLFPCMKLMQKAAV